MRFFTVFIISLIALSYPAKAESDCKGQLFNAVSAPLGIVRSMADYKAALDAGYAACMVSYPKEFAPLRAVNDFMQTNMQDELDLALVVMDKFLEKPPKSVPSKCKRDKEVKANLKGDIETLIDSQYKKAYSRRHRVMSKTDLVKKEQDSCLIVLDMIKKYDEHYQDFDQLKHVLYESSKKQMKAEGKLNRSTFSKFEKARKALTKASN